MSYKTKQEFLKKVDGIIAIAKHYGITIKDLESAHVDSSGGTPRILGALPAYMIWWAHTENRKDIVDRLEAEWKTARARIRGAARPTKKVVAKRKSAAA